MEASSSIVSYKSNFRFILLVSHVVGCILVIDATGVVDIELIPY